MYCYELYQKINPQVVKDMFLYFREEERDIYKTAIKSLAESKKLRPAFVQKKSVADQIDWAHKTLKIKSNNMVGEHLFQVFFLKAHTDMLVDFLDEQDIKHDGQGQIDELPEAFEPEALKRASDKLIETYGADLTSAYLHLFQMQRTDGWEALGDLLENDERLKLEA